MIFGGRASDNNPLNDSWGLRKHRNGAWDWVRAPEKTSPTARYQHSGLFIGSLMLVIGGKTNNINETLPLEVFDTETSEWFSYNCIQRFRHGTWVHEKNLYIYGGFELTSPTLPTDSIYKINLNILLKNNSNLYGKVVDLNSSTSSISSNNSAISNRSQRTNQTSHSTTQSVQNYAKEDLEKPKKGYQVGIEDEPIPLSKKKKRVIVNEPVIGGVANRNRGTSDIRRPLTAKQDLPHFFLNNLMHPENYKNAEALKMNFRVDHIIMLCDMAEEIIAKQPMVLSVRAPLKIFGDIHGQFTDLMTFFALYGAPHENGKKQDIEFYDYIFLGDFVDRGNHSI